MFSPNVTAGISTRNPRRRQRTGSDDSASLRHRPKRLRRSVISTDTFKPPSGKQVNGYIQHVENPSLPNGHAHDARSLRDAGVDITSLAIRNSVPKKAEREKRGNKSDGSIELVGDIAEASSCPDSLIPSDFRPRTITTSSRSYRLLLSDFRTTKTLVRIVALNFLVLY